MRPIASTSVLFALLIPFVASVARPARAEEATEAWKIPYQRCQDLVREGNYPSALEACERAYQMKPEPGILVQLARIQTALVHPVEAHQVLVRYLSGPLEDANRKTAEAQLRYLETLISTLKVSTRFEGAEIRIDDQVLDVSTLAQGVQLPAGAHRITLHANGTTFRRFVVLRAGERTELELPGSGSIALSCAIPEVRFFIDDQEVDAMKAAGGSPHPAGSHRVSFKAESSAWPEQSVTVHPDERVSVVCTAPPTALGAAPRAPINPRGYWVTGAGLLLGVAALSTAIYNGHQYDDWQTANESLGDKSLTFAERHELARANDQLMESIQTTRRVAVGLGIASGLVTAAGVTLFFTDSAASKRNRGSSWFRRVAAGLSVGAARTSGEVAWRGVW